MKATNKILTIALSTLALAACNDLDTEIQGGYATTEQKKEVVDQDPDKLLYAVTGITGNLSQYQAMYSTHADYGYPSLMLWLDSRGIDMPGLNIGYNWYSSPQAMTDASAGNTYGCLYAWRYPFNNINAINTLLSTTGEESDVPEMQFYIAQGRAYRAFDYWVLAQLFQFNYVGHEDAPCVPILTSKNTEEIALAGGAPRATVAKVYEQIIDDLNGAINYLSTCGVKPEQVIDSKPKRLISLATAYGLRARVYLTMGKWAEAAADAQAAISNFSGDCASIEAVSKPCFWSIDESNWMWGIAINETDRVVTSGIVNWPSHMGSLCSNSYADAGAWRMINKALFGTLPATDVRRGWWLDAQKKSENLPETWQAFCDENAMPAYTQVKFAPYQNQLGNTTKGQDIPLMRVEEMYLILAEAQAMGGAATTGAQTLTQFVQQYRDPAYQCTATTPEAVQDAVWLQRRIELWGEGLSYFDIMRLKKPIDRRGGGFPAEWTYNVAPESSVMIYPIPEQETNANKFITPADNNPISAQPIPVTE